MAKSIEAVLLTGGASRRMGRDKANLIIQGEPLARRIARLLSEAGVAITVCGREPIEGYDFQPDREEFAGPLAALAAFRPTRDLVFVCSCDLVGFDPRIVDQLEAAIGSHDAAIPRLADRLQPLCALYRATAFPIAADLDSSGEKRMMRWTDRLDAVEVEAIPAEWLRNANTPADLPGDLTP